MANQHTPNLVAVGTIRPYRAVAPTGSADNACGESNANNLSMGVVQGDTKAHDSANHAEADDQVALQTGNVLLIECGGTVMAYLFCKISCSLAFAHVENGLSRQ